MAFDSAASIGGWKRGSTGISLPVPIVRVYVNGIDSGRHDYVEAGHMEPGEFDAVKNLSPQIWLYRYKHGYSATTAHAPNNGGAYRSDNTRGYVHPSNWLGTANTGSGLAGGAHTTRSGATIQNRESEWDVTVPNKYEAVFNPELWFLDNLSQPLAFPIVNKASPSETEYQNIGASGQGANDTGTYPGAIPAFCGSTRTRGVQVQYFAFAYAVQDPKDIRRRLIGPRSEVVRAEIWPRVKVNYSCPILIDKGRKIRVRHV